MKIAWKPHPQQEKALQSTCFETLYGGARGGGKTDAGMANCLYDIDNKKLRQLVIRRNFPDLKDWIDRAKGFFARNGAKFIREEFVFPSGALIRLGHLADDTAYNRYQGHEYQRLLIEEVTHIPSEDLYLKLLSSCRSTVPGLPARAFLTTNPGEVGHRWVRKRFVDVCDPGEVYKDPVSGRTRIFMPAKVEDNPSLMEKDPDYVKFLDSLPDGLREQWREGSWDDVEVKGAYFLKQVRQAEKEGRITSVPYEKNLPVHTFWDLGMNDPMSIWVVQFVFNEIRCLAYYEDINMQFDEWFSFLRNTEFQGNWGDFVFPHDMNVKELGSGSRKKLAEKYGQDMGFNTVVNKRVSDINEKITSLRMILNRFFFHRKHTAEGVECLRAYHKEFDEKIMDYKRTPKHDWSSHGASSAMEIASYLEGRDSEMNIDDHKRQKNAKLIHDYYSGFGRA